MYPHKSWKYIIFMPFFQSHAFSNDMLFDIMCNTTYYVLKDNFCCCLFLMGFFKYQFIFFGYFERHGNWNCTSGFPNVCRKHTLTLSINLIDNALYSSLLYHTLRHIIGIIYTHALLQTKNISRILRFLLYL